MITAQLAEWLLRKGISLTYSPKASWISLVGFRADPVDSAQGSEQKCPVMAVEALAPIFHNGGTNCGLNFR
jgi:hypothetical protein